MGNRKIQQSEAAAMSEPQQAVSTNASALNSLSSQIDKFIGESKLQGKGWESAKELANVYKTITRTLMMISEQLTESNTKVSNGQAQLLDSQIDEEALNNQMLQNNASLTQLAYASSLWNSINPGQFNPSSNYQNNLRISIGNENAEIQKTLDSMNEFDMSTKYLYDDLQNTLNSLSSLINQVSNVGNTYDSILVDLPLARVLRGW